MYIFWNVIYSCDQIRIFSIIYSSLQCHMIFRNHSNCSRNISFISVENSCAVVYFVETMKHFSLMILWWIEGSKEQHLFKMEILCNSLNVLGICALHLTHPKCTHTAVNTHTPWTHTRSSGQPVLRRLGSSWGFGALLKGLTSVVVLKEERALYIHSPHLQFLPARDSNSHPLDYESDSLTIRPRLPLILMHMVHKSGNTSGVSKSSSDWFNYTGFQEDVCVAFFNVPPGNKDAVMPNSLTKEESRRVYNCDDERFSGSNKRWIFKSMWPSVEQSVEQ